MKHEPLSFSPARDELETNASPVLTLAKAISEPIAPDALVLDLGDVLKDGPLPFADNSFDYIVSQEGPVDFAEVKRVLKPGGTSVLMGADMRAARRVDLIAWNARNLFARLFRPPLVVARKPKCGLLGHDGNIPLAA